MKIRKVRLGLAVILAVLVSSVANAAEVRSISREVKSEFDGETIWTVYVKCAGVSEERAIERSDSNTKWCAEDLPEMCGRKKVKLAKKVCGTHFERLASEYRVEKAKQEALAGGE